MRISDWSSDVCSSDLIARAMLPKIGRVIQSREAKITADLAEAQSAQTRASEAQAIQQSTLAKARGEAQAVVAKATAKVQEENAGRLAVLDAELSDRLAAAEARIGEAAAAASAELDKIAATAAADTVARLAGEAKTKAKAPAVAEARKIGRAHV